ncbi:MAG TPA: hypothetical protein VGD29_12525 [Actinoplanes sp.]
MRAPAYGSVVLRPFADRDVPMVMELATDPYLPLIGSLSASADADQALAFIERQRGRLAEGAGLSFAVADASTDVAVGTMSGRRSCGGSSAGVVFVRDSKNPDGPASRSRRPSGLPLPAASSTSAAIEARRAIETREVRRAMGARRAAGAHSIGT